MNLEKIHSVYFLGIGGIGMSALARFFLASGKQVSGYDKTATALTGELQQEGIAVHFEEDLSHVPQQVTNSANKENVLIVWTPAVPADHAELVWFRENGYTLMKRAQVLGLIAAHTKTIAIAGTHGKTTTTTLTAHLLRTAGIDCSAFLGGISQNYHTNLLLGKNLGKAGVPMEQNIVVAEADEYDRSFLWLHPAIAVITSVDADHLDIYGDKNAMHDTYRKFAGQVTGKLITKPQVMDALVLTPGIHHISYSLDDKRADAYAENIRVKDGYYAFDLVVSGSHLVDLRLGLPGRHNVENAVAAVTAAKQAGADDDSVRKGLSSFRGVKRRFDFRIRDPRIVYIDDYGHHPAELKACISSVRELFPDKKVTGVFQPHLYSRTRDFANEFAESLSLLDDVVLLEIYPAREKPIPGITSSMLLGKVGSRKKALYGKQELVSKIMDHDFDVLLTMGAGDIDQFVGPLEEALREKYKVTEVNA